MPEIRPRTEVRFASGTTTCAAWHYPGSNGGCVVMAGGTSVTRGPATDRFAARFHRAGFSVLALDFRHFGGSGGTPRQVVRFDEQIADYRAAVDFAAGLPEVDPVRIAVWGFSLAGGHVLRVAADHPRLAAAIAQTPLADAPAITPHALRSMTPRAALRLFGRAAADLLGGLAGRPPLLVPTAGPRGTVASLTTADATDGDRALDPDRRHTDWDRTVAARIALQFGTYRPGRHAARIHCPFLVVVCDDDRSALPGPALRAAATAPRAETLRLPGRHYAPFLEAHEPAVTAQLAFLRKHLLADQSDAAKDPGRRDRARRTAG
ncbi:serine aminopeptidase S33 family [Kitasatospora sp. SolWspMP-SS2h]|uniref:alpha/beta hydrolase n=1 Tax=Kitasatospora sp. SolWspMP-SS2h TaxID=1305729 RepID=UPI000DBFF8DE|nr:alpha/beta fold hydrolase [Kitasatospora sp. SolWspMP-SS2h]RAJ47204.1 serine aminopeptidase S33 family [Kitasatospora sp. SolWspMP-SS2h]